MLGIPRVESTPGPKYESITMVIKNLEAILTTRKRNDEKIMEYLTDNPNSITTTDLAEKTGIDIKNISRYLKDLETRNLIKRNTIQDGKIRLVYISPTGRKEITTTRKRIIPKTHNQRIKNVEDTITISPPESNNILTPKKTEKLINIYNELHKEFQVNKKLIPLEKKLEIINWVLEDIDNLYDGVYNYLRIWRTRYHKYLEKEPHSPVIFKFEAMERTLEKIKNLKELKGGLENAKSK